MTRWPIRLFVLLLTSANPGAAQANPWIQALRGPEYAITAVGDTAMASIPLRVDSAVANQPVTLKVWDVRVGTRADARWLDGVFIPSVSGSGVMRSLSLGVDTRKADLQGKYLILLEASTKGRAPVPLELTIVRPAAELLIEPVKLEQVRRWGGDRSGVVLIQEKSGASAISGLQVQPPTFGDAQGATFSLKDPPKMLAVGGTDSIHFSLTDGLPLGTARGTLRLRAPQLATSVEVPVEVRTRRTRWLLFGAILLGLLAGWAVRVWFERWIEIRKLRMQAADVQKRVSGERARTSDPAFIAAIQASQTRLSDALAGSDADELKNAAAAAAASLDKALSALEERLTQAEADVAALVAVDQDRFLPNTIGEDLRGLEEGVTSARTALEQRDASAAQTHVRETRKQVARRLRAEVESWVAKQLDLIERLGREDVSLPVSVAASLRNAVGRISPMLMGLSSLEPDASTADLISALRTIDGVRRGEREMLKLVGGWVRDEVRDVVRELDRAPKADSSAIQTMERTAESFATTMSKAAGDPEQGLALLLGNEADTLDEAFRSAVRAQLEGLPRDKATIVETSLQARSYTKAAQQVAQFQRPSSGVVLGGKPRIAASPVDESLASPAVYELPSFASHAGADGGVFVRMVRTGASPEVIRARAKMEIALASVGRWSVLAVGLVAIGMMFYGPTFVGTVAELATIFIWAFGLNVTADTFLAEGARLKPRT